MVVGGLLGWRFVDVALRLGGLRAAVHAGRSPAGGTGSCRGSLISSIYTIKHPPIAEICNLFILFLKSNTFLFLCQTQVRFSVGSKTSYFIGCIKGYGGELTAIALVIYNSPCKLFSPEVKLAGLNRLFFFQYKRTNRLICGCGSRAARGANNANHHACGVRCGRARMNGAAPTRRPSHALRVPAAGRPAA